MKQSLPKKIEWIPSDYVFGTPKIVSIGKSLLKKNYECVLKAI